MSASQFSALSPSRQLSRSRGSLNLGWEFCLGPDADSGDSASEWRTVNLPHFGRLESYDVSIHFQGLCWYRKTIAPTPAMIGKRVVVEFEAGMQVAEVWVDGKLISVHDGGYLPFFADITEGMQRENPLLLEVRLDNRDNPDVPPGKPLKGMDFCYFSGLYRNVWLHITDPVHVTNACLVDKVGSGGLFIRYENVNELSADVLVQVDVANESDTEMAVQSVIIISDRDGASVAKGATETAVITSHGSHIFSLTLTVPNPKLWSPLEPNLYFLAADIAADNVVRDTVAERIGIRTLSTDPVTGFYINGNHVQPFGTNRHQAYPYIGNALSDNAQYRDAVKLKEAGFDIVRLSHYPVSPAFLDACDELGLLTIVCIPGWQHFSDTVRFRSNVITDMRQTIRRDRNHASAVLWETSLNETLGFDDILIQLIEVAHEEYPGDQMLTCGDTESHDLKHVAYDVPYSGWDAVTRTRPNLAGKMSLHREYGDSQFGGYSRYTRGDGELLMLVQAWNYQTAVNDHLALDYTWGQCTWEAYDNNRGMSREIATCGVMDPFRIPKFMYYFYQSQRSPIPVSPLDPSAPMIYIANYWQQPGQRKVPFVVYSNCDEVEVSINGVSKGRRRPDSGPNTQFGDSTGFDLNYWKLGDSVPNDERISNVESPIFTGGNCISLKHPPFTYGDLSFGPGEVIAVGYIDGKEVVNTRRLTPGQPFGIRLSVDYSGKPLAADGADTIFVYAEIIDSNGTIVSSATHPVAYIVEGNGKLIGDNPRPAEAGISSILLHGGTTAGTIIISASVDGISGASLTLETVPDFPSEKRVSVPR